jgi:ferric-dicitrate binding protein FerR (iron transport regulator)
MSLRGSIARILSLVLACLLLISTTPMASLAEAPPDGALVGSVSAAGPVELRGVRIQREGTLFSGDTLRTMADSYASVVLSGGGRIEMGRDTDVEVFADSAGVEIGMTSGNLVFSSTGSETPLSIRVGTAYRITGTPGATGDVAFLEGNALGVRATSGALTVRAPGSEPVVFDAGSAAKLPLGPAGPAAPAPRRQLTENQWLGIGIAAAAGVIGYVAWRLLRDEASTSTP